MCSGVPARYELRRVLDTRFSISDVWLGLKSRFRAKTYTIFAMRCLVKAAQAAEDDLQAAEKAFADAQAHLELKRAESKIDAHGSSKRKSSTTQAPSNTSTSASDVTIAEETMPDTTLRLGYLLKTYHEWKYR
ncbi:hypothetical protein B0H13DRAFT_1866094 [Mycena leptocephala]|nr:hypothetical protein B0H13DRAFT_1866094 [Mycena leptocephala]